jgi:hypothetical protein
MPRIRRDNATMSLARHLRAAARRALGYAARFAAAALFAVALGSPTRAAATPEATPSSLAPMRFVRVVSGGSTCQPNCPEWISAEGKIVTGTADALERVVAALDGRRLPIFINSAGGSVQDAMAMGRLIRAKRLAVAVAHTAIALCPASAASCGEARGVAESVGAYCASACTLVLAGGVERYVSPLSFVGVHQLTQVVSTTTVKRAYKVRYFAIAWFKWEISRKLVGVRRSTATTRHAADKSVDDSVADYFAEMGVGDPVMALTIATPPRRIWWLTADELAISRLATIRVEGASPVLESEGANGLDGEPIDARSGAASLFVAKSAAPVGEGLAQIESAFAYRRGGGTVLATFLTRAPSSSLPPAADGASLLLTLYPHGAQFQAQSRATGEPARVTIPVRDFCALARGGRAVVSLLDRPTGAEGAAPPAPPVAIDLSSAANAAPLIEEACASRIASAGR